MDSSLPEKRIAERMILLTEQGRGLLARMHNIKKPDPKTRPQFLSEKSLEGAIKAIVKKFPASESINNGALHPVDRIKMDILKRLSNYYLTFVDVMNWRDAVQDVLTTMDAIFVHLDLLLNYNLTRCYLDCITIYCSLFLLMSRVEDKKAVLGLYSTAHDIHSGKPEPNFLRMAQMIVEFENPLKKISEEFEVHSQRIVSALTSLYQVYIKKNVSAEDLKSSKAFFLSSSPMDMTLYPMSDHPQLALISMDELYHWALFCYLCLPSQLIAKVEGPPLWKAVISDSTCFVLIRDEIMFIDKEVHRFLDGIKGMSKRVKEIQDIGSTLAVSAASHRAMRDYLRLALTDMSAFLSDQPGLLGPKMPVVLQALNLARDEVMWLVRHFYHESPRSKKGRDDLVDSYFPQLLFLIEDIRGTYIKHSPLIAKYSAQFLSGYFVPRIKDLIEKMPSFGPLDLLILESIGETLTTLPSKKLDSLDELGLKGVRLDWSRLQVHLSCRSSKLELKDHPALAAVMNTICLQTMLVDSQVLLLNSVSDLSIFCFYSTFFESIFRDTIESSRTTRFLIAFPLLCGHFQNALSDLCPEEFAPVRDRSIEICSGFLDGISRRACHHLRLYLDEQISLNTQANCSVSTVSWIYDFIDSRESGGRKNREFNKKLVPSIQDPIGMESKRIFRDIPKDIDVHHSNLVDFLLTLAYTKTIFVSDSVLVTAEFLLKTLEDWLMEKIPSLTRFCDASKDLARPRLIMEDLQTIIRCLQIVEAFLPTELSRFINPILLQQSQWVEVSDHSTLAVVLIHWYTEVFLDSVIKEPGIVYSPLRQSFISKMGIALKAEEYSDPNELQALATLLGPFGVRAMSQRLIKNIVSCVDNLKKHSQTHRDSLKFIKDNFTSGDQVDEIVKKMKNYEDVFADTIRCGIYLSFRALLIKALQQCVQKRVPFLSGAFNVVAGTSGVAGNVDINDCTWFMGNSHSMDAELTSALKNPDLGFDNPEIWMHLMVLWAVTLPYIAVVQNNEYQVHIEAFSNNYHCCAVTVGSLSECLFSLTNQDCSARMREFLQIYATSTLRIGCSSSASGTTYKNKESAILLFDLVIQSSKSITQDMLESCFPYTLIMQTYRHVYKRLRARTRKTAAASTAGPKSVPA